MQNQTTPLTYKNLNTDGKKGVGLRLACVHTRHLKSWCTWFIYWSIIISAFTVWPEDAIEDVFQWVYLLVLLLMLMEAYCSDTRHYLKNTVQNIVNLYTKLHELKQQRPAIELRAECYHYETRTRTVYSTDANGTRRSRIETHQERVVTHSARQEFQFASWQDKSPPFENYNLDEYRLTKLDLTKDWQCNDEETQYHFNQTFATFKERNKRDSNQNYWTELTIGGFNEKFFASLKDDTLPRCFKLWWFWFWTFMGFSPFFRLWVSSSAGTKSYPIRKYVSIAN